MRVLLAASEVHPFAKTGGLADVAGALPRALRDLGTEVAVCLPLYREVRRHAEPLEVVAERVGCTFAGESRPFRLLRTSLPKRPDIPVFLIENPWVFEAEESFYGTEPGSYGDGHLRFLYFARAIVRVPEAAGFHPDIFHLNDWQTALVAPLIRCVHRRDPILSRAATVLTIHNLAYQGIFPVADLAHAGVPGYLLQEGKLLEAGLGNLLAGGIRHADALSTVSRTYAREILTPEYGNGLHEVLKWHADLIVGIVNGLDTETWDPATDPHLPAAYDADDLSGKARCREALLDRCGLEATEGPVLGCVARLVDQKGLSIVPPVVDGVIARHPDARCVVLGAGEPALEAGFRELAARHPGRVHATIGFDAPLASLIEGGADLFLMPSRFEPCGLNQLISMRYGTPPIVRRVGGLADTVIDARGPALEAGRATGFCFDAWTEEDLQEAVHRAIALFRVPETFRRVQEAGMRADWSFDRAAREYLDLYAEAVRRHEDGSHLGPVMRDLPAEPIEIELPEMPAIPEGYPRDILALVPCAPRTLFCLWELGGEVSASRLEGLAPEVKDGITYELVLENAGDGAVQRHDVGGFTRQWFAQVEPGNHYRGEILMHIPGRPPVRVLDSRTVSMPPDGRPEV